MTMRAMSIRSREARSLRWLLPVLMISIPAVVFGAYELSWWTVDGGGNTSSGGGYELRSTSGQHDVRVMSGGGYVLEGGFWAYGGNANIGIAEPAPAPAKSFALHHGVPNPFNPSTSISFDLPGDDKVRVSVYDARGVLVRRLVDENMTAGSHSVAWDGRDDGGVSAASGVYVVRLEAGDRVATRKVTLVK